MNPITEITANKNVNGYWIVSAIVNGYRVQRTYGGYTKKEAIELFKYEVSKQ